MFPWSKVPKGNDETFRQVTKGFLYVVIGLCVCIPLFFLWVYLERKLGSKDQADQAVHTASHFFSVMIEVVLSLVPLLIGVGLIVYIVSRIALLVQYRKNAVQDVRYIQILPSSDTKLEIDKVARLARTFGGMARPFRLRMSLGIPWFRLRFAIVPGSQEIGIYLAYAKDRRNMVFDSIYSVYPHSEIHEIQAEDFPGPIPGGSGGHFIFHFGRRKGLPLASLEQKKQSSLGDILGCLRPGSYLDLQFAPVSWKELEERSGEALSSLKSKKMVDMNPKEKARKISLTKRLTGRERTLRVRLSLWSNHPQADSVVRSTANAIETAMNYDGAIRFIKHDRWNPLLDTNIVPLPVPFTVMTWDCDEFANLFHIPPGDHWIYKESSNTGMDARGYMVHLKPNERSLSENELSDGVLIGRMKHPLNKRDVRLSYEHLSRHLILTGASGMGKSSLSVEMIQSMLNEWLENPEEKPGFTLIDPAREIIPIIENRLRIAEQQGISFPKEKIHHFDLSGDTCYVPGLNLLNKVEGYSSNQLAHQVAMVMCTEAHTDEVLMNTMRLLSMAIQSLLEDDEVHTILGVEDLFRNPDFREKVVTHVQDPYVKRFWHHFGNKESGRDVDHILHRIDQLLQNPTTRRLFCQRNMTLDVLQYMDQGHIVFVDTYGIQEYPLRVIVGHLINQYYLVAKKRPPGSKFHMVMIDEAQELQIPLFTEIFSDDRKYALGLSLITREIDQFKNEELLQVIRSNVGTILSCGQTEGSKNVESLTRSVLKSEYLEKLPERTVSACIRSKRNQRAEVITCILENEPPRVFKEDGSEANHKTEEKELAHAWGLNWGQELMKTSSEVALTNQVDVEISRSMDPVSHHQE